MRINLADITTREQLHDRLAKEFKFPNSYDRTWASFDAYIRDVALPSQVEIVGLEQLKAMLVGEAQELENRIKSFVEEKPAQRRVTFCK